MTARNYWDQDAGPWVAYRDEPARPTSARTGMIRCYLHDERTGVGMVGGAHDNRRFDTKAEALAAARKRWPRRAKGCRIGAENVTADDAYGPDDDCQTCGAPASTCGHIRPEQEK